MLSDPTHVDGSDSLRLPHGFSIEDRHKRRYGLVIRSDASDDRRSADEVVRTFLTPLLALAGAISRKRCLVRIATFSNRVTTTTILTDSTLSLLAAFKADIEISAYPTSDE
jgi:hypothetical protein